MWQDEDFTKVVQHAGAVVALAEFDRGHRHQRSHVAPEALWRRVVEVIRDVGDGESRILKQASRADETGNRKILLWCRQLETKETTHQCTRQNVESFGETANRRDTRRREEQGFEETPAILGNARQVDRQ